MSSDIEDSSLDIAKRRAGGDELVPDLHINTFLGDLSSSPRRSFSLGAGSWKDRYQSIARSRANSVSGSNPASTAGSPASQYLTRINSRLSVSSSNPSSPRAQTEVGFDENYSYKLGPVLGKGGFSEVRKAVRNDSKVVALKIVDKRAGDIQREITIWQSLNHKHILPLLSVHETHASYYLVTGCIHGGTLFDLVRQKRSNLPIKELKVYLAQLASAVKYMHSKHILHRDIKPENCLLDPISGLLLCDFGLSEYAERVHQDANSSPELGPSRSSASLPVGSPLGGAAIGGSFLFASPELLNGVVGYGSDVWALGVVIYITLTGNYPWQHSLIPKLKQLILESDYDDSKLPEDSRAIVKMCLAKQPEQRATATGIEGMMRECW